jgi:hypothetical protein
VHETNCISCCVCVDQLTEIETPQLVTQQLANHRGSTVPVFGKSSHTKPLSRATFIECPRSDRQGERCSRFASIQLMRGFVCHILCNYRNVTLALSHSAIDGNQKLREALARLLCSPTGRFCVRVLETSLPDRVTEQRPAVYSTLNRL